MTSSPEICGFYSITDERKYEDSTSSLRYFAEPNLPIDLNVGLSALKTKPDDYFQEKMDKILTFIVNNKSEFLKKADATAPDGHKLIPCAKYITYRGILRMIMCSKVSPNPWTIVATKYKGNIYLCQYTSPEKRQKEKNLGQELQRFCNYGPMFEHHCLSEHPNKKPDTSQVCNASTQFFCVLKRSLNQRQFLYAAEMDATDSKTPLDPKNLKQWKPNQFIELKMNCELNTIKRINAFERGKVHSIWAQSYLTGVEKVYVGFRDDGGILNKILCYSIDELAAMSKRNWSDRMSGLGFLNHFLERVDGDFKNIDCPYTTIKYDHDPKTKRLSSSRHEGKTEYSLLPEWYLQEMNKTK